MGYVKLREKLSLEQKTQIPDTAGGWKDIWLELGNHWCMIKDSMGKAVYKGSAMAQRVTHALVVRSSPYSKSTRPRFNQRFRSSDDRTFLIHAVFEKDNTGRYLVCLCEEALA